MVAHQQVYSGSRVSSTVVPFLRMYIQENIRIIYIEKYCQLCLYVLKDEPFKR